MGSSVSSISRVLFSAACCAAAASSLRLAAVAWSCRLSTVRAARFALSVAIFWSFFAFSNISMR